MAVTVKKLQFSEGTDIGAPTDLSLATSTSNLEAYANDAAFVSGEGAAVEGSVYLNTTTKKFRMYVGGAWRNAVPESDPTDATKTFVVDVSGNSTGVASTLDFNNTANRTYTYPDLSVSLSPLTTKGDIMVFNGTDNVRRAVGTNGQLLTADSSEADGVKWTTPAGTADSSLDYKNGSLAASVAANALTIALKDKAGSDPSGGSSVSISFRSATSSTGTYTLRTITSALSVVVSSGSTLGHADGHNEYIYVYAIDNAGTVELAVSSTIFDEGTIVSTTAEGGAGAADSQTVMYSTTARSNVAQRLIGRIKSNQTTAGTWATAPSEISNIPFGSNLTYPVNMDDVIATRLGLKTYLHGTSYRASIAPTVSAGTGSTTATVTRGEFVPYQTQAGQWRCRFNVNITCSSTSRTEYSIQVNGLVWLAGLATLGQSFSGSSNASGAYISRSFADGSGDSGKNMKIVHATGTSSEYCFSGDMACDSKPTWAY